MKLHFFAFALALLPLTSSPLFALNPSREYEITPEDYGMNFKKVKIRTEDQFVVLNGWFFPSKDKNSKKLMIMLDDGEGNMADNLEVCSNFLSLGFSVLMFDYRGYGKSSDFEIKPKFFIYSQFQIDAQHALDWAKKFHAKLTMVDLWGSGIGAGLAICLGVNNLHVRRVIADGPYTDFESAKKSLKAQGKLKLFPPGYNKTELEPKFALSEKQGRHLYGVLFIVAENDPITGLPALKGLAKTTKAKIHWYVRKGADKNAENFSSGTDDYFSRVKAFLEKTSK